MFKTPCQHCDSKGCKYCDPPRCRSGRHVNPETNTQGACNECKKASRAKYRAAHPDRVKASNAKYVSANPRYYRSKRKEMLAEIECLKSEIAHLRQRLS